MPAFLAVWQPGMVFQLKEGMFSSHFDPPETFSEQHRSQWITRVRMPLVRPLSGRFEGL